MSQVVTFNNVNYCYNVMMCSFKGQQKMLEVHHYLCFISHNFSYVHQQYDNTHFLRITNKNARPQDGITREFIRDSHDSNVYQMPQASMLSIRSRLFKGTSNVLPETTASRT